MFDYTVWQAIESTMKKKKWPPVNPKDMGINLSDSTTPVPFKPPFTDTRREKTPRRRMDVMEDIGSRMKKKKAGADYIKKTNWYDPGGAPKKEKQKPDALQQSMRRREKRAALREFNKKKWYE